MCNPEPIICSEAAEAQKPLGKYQISSLQGDRDLKQTKASKCRHLDRSLQGNFAYLDLMGIRIKVFSHRIFFSLGQKKKIKNKHRGSLYKHLYELKINISHSEILKLLLDIARGVDYLHHFHPKIIHRDLKSQKYAKFSFQRFKIFFFLVFK